MKYLKKSVITSNQIWNELISSIYATGHKRHTKSVYPHYLYKMLFLLCKILKQVLALILIISLLENKNINLSASDNVIKSAQTMLALWNKQSLMSLYWLHFKRACISFSTSMLQKGHRRSLSIKFSYLPVSILNGATPLLNLANADLCFNGRISLQYGSISIWLFEKSVCS